MVLNYGEERIQRGALDRRLRCRSCQRLIPLHENHLHRPELWRPRLRVGNRPTEPVVFLKPQSAILSHKHPFYIPERTEEVHHEVELVVKIDRLGKTISEAHASRYYSEVGLGIDFTARDVQSRLKERGHPWERAKAFDGSAVVGGFVSLEQLGKDIQSLQFSLHNHDEVVQEGNTSDMLFSHVPFEVSNYTQMGDLLFTGTLWGCGCEIRDRLVGRLKVTTFARQHQITTCICH